MEHHTHAKPDEVRHGVVAGSTKIAAVSDLRAAMSQGQLDAINVTGDMTSMTEEKKQQIDIELQDKLHALAEGWLWL